MAASRPRWLLRVAVLVAATTTMSLLGGSPSWTDPIQPLSDTAPSAPDRGDRAQGW